jgi:hypothetical protein
MKKPSLTWSLSYIYVVHETEDGIQNLLLLSVSDTCVVVFQIPGQGISSNWP